MRTLRRPAALGFAALTLGLALASASRAGDVTYPSLNPATTVQDTDLIATWRASGPLTKVQASVLNAYILTKLNPVYAQTANNLADLANAATARTNLGLGSAATQNVGASGAAVCLMNANCIWSGTEQFNAATTFDAGVTVNSTLGVTGAVTLSSGLSVGAALSVGGSETVSGSSTITGTMSASHVTMSTAGYPSTGAIMGSQGSNGAAQWTTSARFFAFGCSSAGCTVSGTNASLTRLGVGHYQMSFTTDMSAANFTFICTAGANGTPLNCSEDPNGGRSTSYVVFWVTNTSGSQVDSANAISGLVMTN